MVATKKKIIKKSKKDFCEKYCQCKYFNKSYMTIPKLNVCIAIILFLFNICIPGLGTMFLGLSKGKNHFGTGLIQTCFSVILIGWIFSIIWGLEILKKSGDEKADQNDIEMGDSNDVDIN